MGTPQEARALMQGLHGKRVRGYELHISFAFVQRSGGPGMNFNAGPSSHSIDHAQKLNASQPPRSIRLQEAPRGPPFTIQSVPAPSNGLYQSNAPLSCAVIDARQFIPSLKSGGQQNGSGAVPSPTTSSYGSSVGFVDSSGPSPVSFSEFTNQSSDSQPSHTPVFTSEIFLYNVSPVACIDSDDLHRYLTNQGLTQIKNANLNMDEQTGMSLGTGSIEFHTLDAAAEAYRRMSTKPLNMAGSVIKCERATMFPPVITQQFNPYAEFHSSFAPNFEHGQAHLGQFNPNQLPNFYGPNDSAFT